MHGISRQNTKIDWTREKITPTDGIATQPKEGDPEFGHDLASGTETPQLGEGTSTPQLNNADIVLGAVRANNTATLPARPLDNGANDFSPSDTQPRTGTSDTRYEQQAGTHAAGQLASGTPHTVHYGQGDKAVTIEPTTIGQAPKDVRANLPSPEEPDPPAQSYLAQAQSVVVQATASASAAVGAVAGKVGIGKEASGEGEKEKGEGQGGEGKEEVVGDEKVEGLGDEVVEEYLRSQYPSTHASNAGGS